MIYKRSLVLVQLMFLRCPPTLFMFSGEAAPLIHI
jgi:hypothetical protein